MSSLLTALILATSFNTAEAKPHKRRHPPKPLPVHVVVDHNCTKPHYAPRRARSNANHVTLHPRGYWTYPHGNSALVWRWTPGHYNRRGVWISGYWRVVVRL